MLLLTLLFNYLLTTKVRFDAMLCSIMVRKLLMQAILNVHAGHRFTNPA